MKKGPLIFWFATAVTTGTLAFFRSQAKAKGVPPEIEPLLSQLLAMIRDGNFPNYRIEDKEPFIIRGLSRDKIWRTFGVRIQVGRDMFLEHCARIIASKADKYVEKHDPAMGIPRQELQPELGFYHLLKEMKRIDLGKK